MEIITITNQKGGAGKTTTALALLSGLSKRGFKVLAVDLDAQTNLTYTLRPDLSKPTTLEILTKKAKLEEAIQHTESGDFIASSKFLAGADNIINETGKEWRLKEAIEESKINYDYVIIDTPPALSILTINALTCCNSVIIPAQAEFYSMQGIERLNETIEPVRKYTNKDLQLKGILLTRYNGRSNLSKDYKTIAGQTAEKIGTKLFNTCIRECTAIKEAQTSLINIFDYAPNSNASEDYNNFINELIEG